MSWTSQVRTRAAASEAAAAAAGKGVRSAPRMGNQARLRLGASPVMLRRTVDEEADAAEAAAPEEAGSDAETLGAAPQPGDEPSDIEVPGAKKKTKKVEIAFRKNGEGTLTFGSVTYKCLGCPTVKYTKDLTVQGKLNVDKFRHKYSKEFDVMLDWAILIMGQRGIYIHEMPDTIAGNGGDASAGCIHLGPGHAQTFYNWVNGPTRITISYPW